MEQKGEKLLKLQQGLHSCGQGESVEDRLVREHGRQQGKLRRSVATHRPGVQL